MSAPATDAVGMLRWGLRRYALLFFACLLLGAAVAPITAAKLAKPADAEALVLAQRLDTTLSALPRYGEGVFGNGEVAQAVAAKFGNPDNTNVVPNMVSLVADQDSIVFHVVGHDPNPKRAAGIANTAAAAFTTALNNPGVGVGAFVLQSPALPPPPAPQTLSRLVAVPVGVTAGVVLGLAVVLFLLVVRRPIIDEAAVEEMTGVPALGTVVVPRTRRGRFAKPDQFAGLVPVCRRLLRLPTPVIVVLSRNRDRGIRRQLSVALATVLARVRDVTFMAPEELVAMTGARSAAQGTADGQRPLYDLEDDGLTLVESIDTLDLVHPPDSTATVLVVRVGIGSAALRAAVVEHLGGSAEARVVLVKRGRRVRGNSPAAAPGGPVPRKDVVLVDGR